MTEHKEVVPRINPTKEIVIELWKKYYSAQIQLEAIFRPAQSTILQLHQWIRDMHWEPPVLTQYGNGDVYVVLTGSDFYEDHPTPESWELPIEAAIEGRELVKAFFEELKRRKEAAAAEQGRLRMAKEQEERRKMFEKLKLEFEPPEAAIVKHEGS